MDTIVNLILNGQAPFAILFGYLFIYVLKTNKEREERNEGIINGRLEEIDKDVKVMLAVWKTLLEKELERREDTK